MNKNFKSLLIVLITCMIATGCNSSKEYSEEYNYETDDQYSYMTSVTSWKKVQSDGNGQYILFNNYIYYYNNDTKDFAPLCNKANCLHDRETDEYIQNNCNAYVDRTINSDENDFNDSLYDYIQYYEGNVYYVIGDSLFAVSSDGATKKKVFSTGDEAIVSWLLHKGNLYYEAEEFSYDNDKTYTKGILKKISVGSSMKSKNAETIFETDDALKLTDFGRIQAFGNKIFSLHYV